MPDRVRPGPGQESVWDYPRPPRAEPTAEHVVVELGGGIIADTREAVRVLETSHPPTYYLPPGDVRTEQLRPTGRTSFCEFKGVAVYHEFEDRGVVGWSYPEPVAEYAVLRDRIAFYPSRVDRALVDGVQVQAQSGDFYGGWITPRVVGPFKGPRGTLGW